MVFAGDEDDDGGDDGADEEGEVDLDVCEEDEPFVSRALFEFARGFGAAYAAGWVFATDAWGAVGVSKDDPSSNSWLKKNTYLFLGKNGIRRVRLASQKGYRLRRTKRCLGW